MYNRGIWIEFFRWNLEWDKELLQTRNGTYPPDLYQYRSFSRHQVWKYSSFWPDNRALNNSCCLTWCSRTTGTSALHAVDDNYLYVHPVRVSTLVVQHALAVLVRFDLSKHVLQPETHGSVSPWGITGAIIYMAAYALFPAFEFERYQSWAIGASASVMAIVFAV